jgi:hypothetical protein
MTSRKSQSSAPTTSPELVHQFLVRHQCLEEDLGFALASLGVRPDDAEAMRSVFASLIAMGAARLLELEVPQKEVELLASDTIAETALLLSPAKGAS